MMIMMFILLGFAVASVYCYNASSFGDVPLLSISKFSHTVHCQWDMETAASAVSKQSINQF